jgi:hypothetical protein
MNKIFLLSCLIVLADKGQSFEDRKAGIVKRWGELPPVFAGEACYDISPSSGAPYEAGKGKETCLKDALNTLNFYRCLAGLPDRFGNTIFQ